MNRLQGKVAIVTGSSSGIGKAIARRFAEQGAKVVVAARRLPLCERTVEQIRECGGEARAIRTDVTDERQVEALFDRAVSEYGRVDVLVNNAGVMAGGRLVETPWRTSNGSCRPICVGRSSVVVPASVTCGSKRLEGPS